MTAYRRSDEIIVMVLSGAISVGIFPFLVIRLVQQSWPLAILDAAAVCLSLSLFLYVYRTGKTQRARWVLAIVCFIALTLTLHIRGSLQILWVFPALTAIFFLLPPRSAVLVCSAMLFVDTIILWQEMTSTMAIQFLVTSISSLCFCYAFSFIMRKQQQELTLLATRDPLTNAGNRRGLEEKLLTLIQDLKQEPSRTASILLIDLDRFKDINDKFGHAVGDRVLIQFVDVIRQKTRSQDNIYRYGGEEFVIVVDDTNQEGAAALAENLRAAVAAENHEQIGQLTISLGVAEHHLGESIFAWLERADLALYQAKESGRNTFKLAQ